VSHTYFAPGNVKVSAFMTAREAQLLWLAYAEGFSHREIARMTDLGEKSIRPLLFRAREKLASLLTAAGHCRQNRRRI
jgi:DNA-directed RNA polymerase specialized sigma24 family protein